MYRFVMISFCILTMHSWTHGSPDRDQPPAPPASQDAVMVPDSNPEQFLISSSSSIPSAAAASSAAAAADQGGADQGDEFASKPVSSNPWEDMDANVVPSWVPDDKSRGQIVPASLPVMVSQCSQDTFEKFLDVSYKCGFLKSAHEIMWPKYGLHAQPRQITKVMELIGSHIDWEFIGTHEIKHN